MIYFAHYSSHMALPWRRLLCHCIVPTEKHLTTSYGSDSLKFTVQADSFAEAVMLSKEYAKKHFKLLDS